jgi:hypothetical protein
VPLDVVITPGNPGEPNWYYTNWPCAFRNTVLGSRQEDQPTTWLYFTMRLPPYGWSHMVEYTRSIDSTIMENAFMFTHETNNTWHVRLGFDMHIDYCIWLLEHLGLQVPPFDKHFPPLSIKFMEDFTQSNWLLWLHQLVALRVKILEDFDRMSIEDIKKMQIGVILADPVRLWPGENNTKNILNTLLQEYRSNVVSERQDLTSTNAKYISIKEIWSKSIIFKENIDFLNIIHVGYVKKSILFMPPQSIILSLGRNYSVDSVKDIHEKVIEAVSVLIRTDNLGELSHE